MKIGPFKISLAKKPAPPVNQEIGSSKSLETYLAGEVFNPDKVKIKDLIKMRKSDGTATALYNIITMPVMANPSSIEAKDDSAEAKKQAEFVRGVLYTPPHEGGMSTPFDLVLADMLRAVVEGYRVYEKVFELKDGKITYKKIAIRDNQTVSLLTDSRGGFAGFKQLAYIDNKFQTVTIPVQRAFLFTYGKEHNNLAGESAFRAAYYHYDKKHRLYYLAHEAMQQFAIPPKVAIAPPNADDGSIQGAANALGELGVNAAVGLPNGYDAKVLSSNGRIDPVPLIDHHNAEMARSILAQFMMLGTGGSTGSWALSSDQTDMFILALRSVLKQIESHINSYLIPDLIDYNFEKPMYPKFEFADITESTQNLLRDIAMKLFEQKPEGIPQWLLDESVKRLAQQLDIDVPQEEDNATESDTSMSHKPRAAKLADMKWKRPLTPAEAKVNFAGIQRKYDQLEQDIAQIVKPIWDTIRANTVKDLRKLLEKGDLKALDSFVVPGVDEYQKALYNAMLEAYGYAKVGAADEMEKKAPANKTETKDLLKLQAQSIVDKQVNDLLFDIRNAVNTAKRKNQLSTNLSIGDVLTTVGELFGSYLADKVKLGIATAVAIAINAGRDDVFTTYRNVISKYQYSALMDDVTCPICEDLDGSVVDEAEYRETDWLPPVHLNCRCIWVEILEVEEVQPEITGLPAEPGGTPAPALSAKQEWGKELKLSELMDKVVDKKLGTALDAMLKETDDESDTE